MPRLLPDRFAVECIREFDRAATERYTDAIWLADADRRTGVIYLFGYVVEMVLKSGFLRLVGHTDEDPITTGMLWDYAGTRPTSTARSLGLPGATNLHDLAAWAELIVAVRQRRGRDYADPGFAALLVTTVRTVHDRWTEALRYHRNVAYSHEGTRVRLACHWVVSNRRVI